MNRVHETLILRELEYNLSARRRMIRFGNKCDEKISKYSNQ